MLGIIQLLIWLLLIAFVFTAGFSGPHSVLLPGISVWYGYIALASFSTLSVVLASTILYSNASLAYCFRFTHLEPRSYLIDLIGSYSILAMFLSIIHMIATFLIFSYRFNDLLYPINPSGAIIVSIFAGIFMMDFGLMLSLVAINYTGLQSVGLLNFLPIMLTVVFGLTQIFTTLPQEIVLFSPFNEIESLLFLGYSNKVPHIQLLDYSTTQLSWQILFLGLIFWILVLTFINSQLLQRLKPRDIEEARPL